MKMLVHHYLGAEAILLVQDNLTIHIWFVL